MMRFLIICFVGLLFTGTTSAGPQPEIVLSLTGGAYPTGASFDSAALFDHSFSSPAPGWSFGVCHDNSALALTDVREGATTLTVNGGAAPDFIVQDVYPGGFTQGVVISFVGLHRLEPGLGYELAVATYTNLQSFPDSTTINYCDTLGVPPVANVIVFGGASLVPVTLGATIETLDIPLFSFRASSETAGYHPVTGISFNNSFVNLSVEGNELSGGDNLATQGFSFGLAHDPQFLTPISLEAAPALADLNGGVGPDFMNLALHADGVTAGIIYSFGTISLFFEVEKDVAVVEYAIDASSLVGTNSSVNSALSWSDSIGMPPVENVIVSHGNPIVPEQVDGLIQIVPIIDPLFIRGDCNGDFLVDIADGIWSIAELFNSGPASSCFEACDANSDGIYDVSDAIFVFNFRFLGGPPPAAPYPNCGDVAGADCDSSFCP